MADPSISLDLASQEQSPSESTVPSSPQQQSVSQPATPRSKLSLVSDEKQQLHDVGTAKLCTYCLGILTLLREKEPWSELKYKECFRQNGGWPFPHYSSIDDLQKSGERGCHLCVQLSSSRYGSFIGSRNIGIGMLSARGENSWTINLSLLISNSGIANECFRGCHINKIPEHYISLISGFNDTSQTSKDTLPLAKIWLQNCRQRHTSCHTWLHPHSQVLPTRLLDLQYNNLKLVSGNNLDNSTEYATLSHCWGNTPFIKLKCASITQYFTEILYEDLPQTFQDAVYIARFLGLSYLWIDSLCIIQDDDNDWKKESARMASVYSNSALTIAASGALNSSVGCFIKRAPSWRCQLATMLDNNKQLYECIPSGVGVENALENQPLLYRGWVVQERILSPRMLHFTSNQLVWECKQSRECETCSDGGLILFPTPAQEFKPPLKLRNWQSLIELYCSCKLTDIKDKLVALSGLAQASRLGDCQGYVVGLWKNNIEQQLLWFTREGLRSSSYRAPSWSWASIDGGISFSITHQTCSLYVKVHEVNTQLARQEEPYGEVQSSVMRLLCTYLLPNDIIDRLTFPERIYGIAKFNYEWWFDDKLEMNRISYRDCFLLPVLLSYGFRGGGDPLSDTSSNGIFTWAIHQSWNDEIFYAAWQARPV